MTTMKWPLMVSAAREVERAMGTPQCRKFRRQIFERFEAVADDLVCGAVAVATTHGYSKPGNRGNAEANIWLRIMQKQLMLGPFNVTHEDEALEDYARAKADAIVATQERHYRTVRAGYAEARRRHFWRPALPADTRLAGLTFRRHVWPTSRDAEIESLREGLEIAHKHSLDVAPVVELKRLSGSQRRVILSKLGSAPWWRRKLRTLANQRLDQFMRMVRRVHKRAGIYVSDMVFKRWQRRQNENLEMLEGTTAINQFEQEYTLAELSAKSVGNRDIRFKETMMRIRETEAFAHRHGHRAVFVTWTLPSAWHAVLQESGQSNPKYNGSTPRDAHAQLQKLWTRARAKLKRDGIAYYGIRTVEPHHDGCPHWHMLLWVAEDQIKPLEASLRRYALSIDPEEVAGKEHVRIRFEHIDPTKGSAAGYVIKYVAKNINCTQRSDEVDQYGRPMDVAAPRIAAWASVHGIRQFQFFGLPSVTVWRELRRLRDPDDDSFAASCFEDWIAATKPDPEALAILHDLRRAANGSRWDNFLELCGGPCVPMTERPARPWRMTRLDPKGEHVDPNSGEIRVDLEKLGIYGEPVEATIGITVTSDTGEASFMTRVYRWEIKPTEAGGQRSDAVAEPWTRVNNCTGPDIEPRQPGPQEAHDQEKRYKAWRASTEVRAEMEGLEEYEHQLRAALHQKFAPQPEWGAPEYFPPELESFEEATGPVEDQGPAPQNPVTAESQALWQLLISSAEAEQRRRLGIDDETTLRLAAMFFEPPAERQERSNWSSLMLGINRKRTRSPRGGQMSAEEARLIAAGLWEAPAPTTPFSTQHA
ncbi:replication endonuclease [Chromohalobacter canadensis]|uniref:Replication endonuclease n=1 Tax=Chromohalobacter canadensis TaxID=141389 RepID=A0ABZ0Y9X2_9GAMM|nr:replication endonuclease [Chromohalobacter canadensis]MCK0767939.1 replication endonuclease [Chromohalobacter canadensis]WQH08508.1 replication endonuclease [Chromohalobacter canadensis]